MAAAIEEFGVNSPEQVQLEVIEEPQKGLFGLGGKDGLFRVSQRSGGRRRRRRRGRSSKGSSSEKAKDSGGGRPEKSRSSGRSGGGADRGRRSSGSSQPSGGGRSRQDSRRQKPESKERSQEEEATMPDLNQQATVVNDFLVGLLDAFGLEGTVETSVKEEDIIVANVNGEQAEALIGPKGSILQAILELTRTVVQRKTQAGARIRLDIGGYTERRRAALKIYAARLAERVVEDGEEVMLEPMNPADRKAVHDVISEIDGVRSYSEGEEPQRSVVISPSPTE
jgi:spoIIIJ-associated protein